MLRVDLHCREGVENLSSPCIILNILNILAIFSSYMGLFSAIVTLAAGMVMM